MRLAALALCACSGTTGTLAVELTTAPDSHVLDAVQRLRLTITNPRQVVEAARGAGGFALALDVGASGVAGALIVEGFDAGGVLVACGQSPAFPVAAIDARIAVYMAPPRSFAAAPVALATPRAAIGGSALDYGVVLAGGRDAAGAASDEIAIYNAYDHTLVSGIKLPGPRAGVALATAGAGVYLFGGAEAAPTGTLWRFDTTVPPNGAYTITTDHPEFARADQRIVPVGSDRFLITGAPALVLARGAVSARTDIAGLPAAAAAVVASDGVPTAIFAGAELVRFRGDAFDALGPGREGASAAALPDGRVVVIGGGEPASRDALVIDAATGAVTVIAGAIATPRARPSLAATARHLVVAGGSDAAGAPIATAEVLDATTLAPIAILPIVPRTGAFAIALPTDQVMLAGGAPASGVLELFTPEPPPATQ